MSALSVSVSVAEFVSLLNQTLEYAYPRVIITGELAHFKVSRSRWVHFDLKDTEAKVRFFGTVYDLPGPLEDGMMLAVTGSPKFHPQFGFSVQVQSIQPVGQGSIKKAATLLQVALEKEGLFGVERKRMLPYPPRHVGLVTSGDSAAYHDFAKVLQSRWGDIIITLIDVQVQGELASAQIVAAITQFNQLAESPEVIVITRGGGSAEDLQAFNTEHVTRAIAASRIPTLVAIGHEVDVSLAELAADCRSSTPSNAAELLVPDKKAVLAQLYDRQQHIEYLARCVVTRAQDRMAARYKDLHQSATAATAQGWNALWTREQLLTAFNPRKALQRGYGLVRNNRVAVTAAEVKPGDRLDIEFADGIIIASAQRITMKD